MRHDPLSYRGALRLLGRYDRPALDALDGLLSGFVLAAPAVAPLAAAFGWIERKDEALGLVRRMLDAVADHLAKTRGYERQQLVRAAHTTIVLASFFEALEAVLGTESYRALALTDEDRRQLTARGLAVDSGLVRYLYEVAVPMPSATAGFAANQQALHTYLNRLGYDVLVFLRGLAAGERFAEAGAPVVREVVSTALARYRGHYHRLCADVPEFGMWAELTEHAATQAAVAAVLSTQDRALSTVEELLRLVSGGEPDTPPPSLAVLERANRAALAEEILPHGELSHVDAVRFPTVEQIYMTPRYRVTGYRNGAQPASEQWWASVPVRDDLGRFLAAHFCAADSTRAPLLVLAHPGGGKSLLTKVLAARLPASGYTVVRVPLRGVDADAPLYRQIQQALDGATHARASWADLADDSADRIRVVLLDGFDELVQATPHGRAGYLQEIAEFQRVEAAQERPVAVVVTSRTVVADRARIPDGTVLVRVEEFTDGQVGGWLAAWRQANAAAVDSGAVRALTPSDALRHPDLARQPLLLLMLALYVADRQAPPIDDGLSTSALYGRLLDNFVRRELGRLDPPPPADELAEAVRDRLWRLAVAAFAMANRGRQSVSDEELGADLGALTGPAGRVLDAPVGPARLGQHAIGQFFFVHVAEADAHRGAEVRRSYEFLHATFGDFLIANEVVAQLAELARGYRPGRRTGRDVDDELLYALLSQHPVAVRPPVRAFATELFGSLDAAVRDDVGTVLEALLRTARNRQSTGRFDRYRPLPPDRVRELAAYTANLVLLRVYLTASVPVDRLADDMTDWRSLVGLWRAGLDEGYWLGLVQTLDVSDEGNLRLRGGRRVPAWQPELGYAQLTGDFDLELQLRAGMAAQFDGMVTVDSEPNLGELFALLVHGAAWTQMSNFVEPKHVMDTVRRDPGYYRRLPTAVREAIGPFLRNQAAALPYDVVRDVVGLLLIQLSPVYCPDVALAIACHPWLLVDLPDLAFTGTWLGPESPPAWVRVVLRAAQARASGEAAKRLADLLRELPPPASALEPDNHVAAVLIRLFRAATSQSTHS